MLLGLESRAISCRLQYFLTPFLRGFVVNQADDGAAQGKVFGLELLLRGRLPNANGHGYSYFDTQESGAGATLQVRSTVNDALIELTIRMVEASSRIARSALLSRLANAVTL
jgi:hypothetical protein